MVFSQTKVPQDRNINPLGLALLLVLGSLALSACGNLGGGQSNLSSQESSASTSNPPGNNPPVVNPTPVPTPGPTPIPTPAPTPSPTPIAAPAAPASLRVQTTTSTSATLTWTTVPGATGYIIEGRATFGFTDFGVIAQVGNVTTYTNTGLNNNWQYTWEVIAVNAGGNSLPSAWVTLQVLGNGATVTAPALGTPTGLTANSPSASTVTLNWTAVSGATGYIIARKLTTSSTSFITIGQVTGTTYTDGTVTSGAAYYYEVLSVNATEDSAVSSPVTVTSE